MVEAFMVLGETEVSIKTCKEDMRVEMGSWSAMLFSM